MENDPLKVLAIDDNEDNLISVKALIREAFPQALVLTATEAGNGIELARTENPDVILLDVVMPGMDGFEACEQLKANPLTRCIPVVFLTAIKGDREARIRALEVGAEAFLSKPIDEIELTAQIRAMQKIKAASARERAEKENLAELVAARTRELDLAHTAALNLLEDLRKENTARQESDAHLRLLFENLPSGVVVHAADTAVLFANPEALRLLGLTLQQIQGKTATDPAWGFLREDGEALALEDYPVNRLRTSGKSFAGQIVGIRLPGRAEPNWVQCSAYPQLDANGLISQVIVAFTDITARQQAEEALRESEQRHRDYLTHSPYGIFVADEQGRYVQANPAACSITGYSEKELLSKSVSDLHGEESREDAARHFQAVVREGKATGELKFRPKSGESRWWLVSAVKISDTRFLGFCNDITDRKQAEEKEAESQALLRLVLDRVPAYICAKNLAGRFLLVNQNLADFYGRPIASMTGSLHADLCEDKEELRAMLAADRAVIESGQFQCIPEETMKNPDGSIMVLETYKIPFTAHNEPAVLVASTDITARKRVEAEYAKLQAQFAQAQKMEAVGRLAGGVAHDFNNLLMGIMNYAQLCRDRIEPGHPIREYLGEITHDAERSAEITRQLLAFARKQTIAPRVLDLNDAVAGMLKLLRRLIGEDINLAWRPGADLRPVKLDPSQVDQILANLCVNARDAIAGVGEVTLETGSGVVDADYCARHPEAIPGAYVYLAVSDNGCGMDKETLAQVFEPFFTTKGLGKGTGLGLATVYGIVKQNNGFIYAYSEPGKGTTFKIYLPEIAAETVATTVARKTKAPRGRGETILVVEDEKSLRVTCGLFLEALDYKVLVAETPGEALKMTAQHPGDIHVLLTDVVMPGMDGRQLAQRISALRPGVKVLFMSGYTADVIAQRGVLDEGMQFLSKPFTRNDLARKVREMLDGPRPG